MEFQIQLHKSIEFQVFIFAAPIEDNMIFAPQKTHFDTIWRTLKRAYRGQIFLAKKGMEFQTHFYKNYLKTPQNYGQTEPPPQKKKMSRIPEISNRHEKSREFQCVLCTFLSKLVNKIWYSRE